jgi:hypothetical protein
MANDPGSVDEIIATLSHSRAPSLILEGKTDYIAFEEFEIENVSWGLTVFPVKGKTKILELLERRGEIANPNLLFLIDQDEWILVGCPECAARDDVMLTWGAAIENDLIQDGEPWVLMNQSERDKFWRSLASYEVLYRHLLADHLADCSTINLKSDAASFLDNHGNLKEETSTWLAAHTSEVAVPADLAGEPLRYVRGKAVLRLVTAQLSARARGASKFGNANVLEIGARKRGPIVSGHEQRVLDFFDDLRAA